MVLIGVFAGFVLDELIARLAREPYDAARWRRIGSLT